MPIVKLRGHFQHYAWGSHTAIAALQGRAGPTQEPEAELWLGDHPAGPATVLAPGGEMPIGDWIARDREGVLGPHTELPFLVKLLAAASPLSIQVHPDAARAAEGFEREERRGLPRGQRSYPDPREKRELLVALSRVEALCGFRSDAVVAELVEASESRVARELLWAADPERPSGASIFHALQQLDSDSRRLLLGELSSFARTHPEEAEGRWIDLLLKEHPDDALAAAPLLLHGLVLEPGDALAVEPGTVHSYLSGMGVEVMTRSDNVVRGGLTRKHVDHVELRRLVGEQPAEPQRPRPEPATAGERCYPTGNAGFRVSSLELSRPGLERAGGRVEVLLCVEGEARFGAAEGGGDAIAFGPGEGALVPASQGSYRLAAGTGGTARVFAVSAD